MDNLKAGLEAILFTCDEPITLGKLKDIFPDAKPDEIREALAGLKADYDQTGRAFSLEEIAGGYQLLTRSQHADIIAKLKKAKADRKLSAAALENALGLSRRTLEGVDFSTFFTDPALLQTALAGARGKDFAALRYEASLKRQHQDPVPVHVSVADAEQVPAFLGLGLGHHVDEVLSEGPVHVAPLLGAVIARRVVSHAIPVGERRTSGVPLLRIPGDESAIELRRGHHPVQHRREVQVRRNVLGRVRVGVDVEEVFAAR